MLREWELLNELVKKVQSAAYPDAYTKRQAGDAVRKAIARAEGNGDIRFRRDRKRVYCDRNDFWKFARMRWPHIVGKVPECEVVIEAAAVSKFTVGNSLELFYGVAIPSDYQALKALYSDLSVRLTKLTRQLEKARTELDACKNERDKYRDKLNSIKAVRRAAGQKGGRGRRNHNF